MENLKNVCQVGLTKINNGVKVIEEHKDDICRDMHYSIVGILSILFVGITIWFAIRIANPPAPTAEVIKYQKAAKAEGIATIGGCYFPSTYPDNVQQLVKNNK